MDYKYPTPQLLLKAICNAIRSKTGNSDEIPHQNIPDELDNFITEEEYNIEMQRFIDIIEGTSFINDRITTVKNNLFHGCASLTTIDLPECTSIREYTFSNCTSLTTVNLPKCTSIEYFAFQDCTSLTTIDLPECTSIREYAFSNCTSLTTVNLPKCTSIEYYNTFEKCTSLTTVNLPKCTSIGDAAFYSCTSLTTINLPECTSIGCYVFNECTNLTTIILSNNQVVNIDITTFSNSAIANGTGYVYIPDNLVDSYKTATGWNYYANQIKPLSELPSNLKEEYGYD